MESGKMRNEFSAWYLDEVTQSYGKSARSQAEKNLDWIREDGSFGDPLLRLACLAWQASRESIVIELPFPEVPEDYGVSSDDDSEEYERLESRGGAQCSAIFKCKKAIEAAGLKVKP